MEKNTPSQGQYGSDGAHEFKVTDVVMNGAMVEIEYLSDSATQVVESSRFEQEAPGFDWQLN